MNVTPPHTRPHPLPNLDGAPSRSELKQPRGSFDQVLTAAMRAEPGVHPDDAGSAPNKPVAAAPDAGIDPAAPTHGRSGLEHGAPVKAIPPAAAQDYRASREGGTPVAIGEDAVRFDARPVVGRSFVAGTPAEGATAGYAEPAPRAAANLELVEPEAELHRTLALVAARVEAVVSRPVSWTVAAPVSARRSAGAAKDAAARPMEALSPTRAGRWIAPAASAASAVPAAPPAASRSDVRANIALTLLADEVLVTVRGLDLSPDEEEALADEARRLLASSDFGGRPLRVLTSGRA